MCDKRKIGSIQVVNMPHCVFALGQCGKKADVVLKYNLGNVTYNEPYCLKHGRIKRSWLLRNGVSRVAFFIFERKEDDRVKVLFD